MNARCCVACGSLLSCSTQTTNTHGCRAFGRALPNSSPCRPEASSALQTVTSVSTSRTPCHRQHAHLHNAPLSSQCHSLCPLAGHARSALKRTATAGSPLSFPLLSCTRAHKRLPHAAAAAAASRTRHTPEKLLSPSATPQHSTTSTFSSTHTTLFCAAFALSHP